MFSTAWGVWICFMSVTFRAWYWWPDLALSLGRYSACNRASHLKWKKARTSSSDLVRVWWSAYMSICSNIILSSRRPDQAPKDQPSNAVFSPWRISRAVRWQIADVVPLLPPPPRHCRGPTPAPAENYHLGRVDYGSKIEGCRLQNRLM